MSIAAAQRDVRRVYAGGFYGQLVSGAVWLVAAAAATWFSPPAAVGALFFGGMLIYPLTTLVIRLSGRPSSLLGRAPDGTPGDADSVHGTDRLFRDRGHARRTH
ncbi:DUF7010 family protein [Pseudarthrobacter sp. So.54]